MTATADSIIERRRLRRRLAFWRILAVIAVLGIVALLVPRPGGGASGEHVARVPITGIIVNDRDRLKAIREAGENENVRALILDIASTGGTVVGSEALFDEIRRVAEDKPVVAVIGEVAASGGYIAAMSAEHIISRRNSITGSIGVIGQVPDISDLLDSVGVSVTEIRSTPLKAAPSPFEPHSPEAIDALEALLLDSYEWFTTLVGERRGLEGEALAEVTDGRVYTGAQAIGLGLVDALGDETTARDWLSETHGIDADLPVRELRWGERDLPFPLDSIDEMGALLWGPAPLSLPQGPRIMALWTG